MAKKRSSAKKEHHSFLESMANRWKMIASLVVSVVAVVGIGWTWAQHMGQYAKTEVVAKKIDKSEAEKTHMDLQEGLLVVQVQVQSAYDTQIEGLYERINQIKEIRKKRPLNADEAGRLEYFEKQLENAKRMRQLQIQRQIK